MILVRAYPDLSAVKMTTIWMSNIKLRAPTVRGDEWSLRAFASMPSTAIFLRATQKFGKHEQASTSLNFASKSSKGKILRAVKNFNGPFIIPTVAKKCGISHWFPCGADGRDVTVTFFLMAR